jgi:hypothetical protein
MSVRWLWFRKTCRFDGSNPGILVGSVEKIGRAVLYEFQCYLTCLRTHGSDLVRCCLHRLSIPIVLSRSLIWNKTPALALISYLAGKWKGYIAVRQHVDKARLMY